MIIGHHPINIIIFVYMLICMEFLLELQFSTKFCPNFSLISLLFRVGLRVIGHFAKQIDRTNNRFVTPFGSF